MNPAANHTIHSSLLRWLLIPAWSLAALAMLASLLLHKHDRQQHLMQQAQEELCLLANMYDPLIPLPDMLRQLELASSLLSGNASHGAVHFRFNSLPTLVSVGGPPLPVPDEARLLLHDSCTVRFHTLRLPQGRFQVASLLLPATGTQGHHLLIQSMQRAAAVDAHILELGRHMALTTLVTVTLFSLIVLLGVRRGLRPLQQLVSAIRQLDSSKPGPVRTRQPPHEIRYIEDTLNQQLALIGQQVQRERTFLNDAAHQLRTPIAGIMSQAELALEEAAPPQLQWRLQQILQASERSATLIRQLLALSRGYAHGALGTVPFDLPALAREVALHWVGPAADAGIEISYEGESHALLHGNPDLIREALHNMLDNVLQHARNCTEAVISVYPRQQQGRCQLVLQVQDNGDAVPAAQLEHLFERFWSRSETHGNGIGLALVREIAQARQGRVEAVLRHPRGLLVRMYLPVVVT